MSELQLNHAREISRLHEEIAGHLRTSLEKAIRIGELLVEQKATFRHGDFGRWIQENLPFTNRTARNYMKLYKHRDQLKTETVSDLKSAYQLMLASQKLQDFRDAELQEIERANEEARAIPPTITDPEIDRLQRAGFRQRLQKCLHEVSQEQKRATDRLSRIRALSTKLESLLAEVGQCDLWKAADTLGECSTLARGINHQQFDMSLCTLSRDLRHVLQDPLKIFGCLPVVSSAGMNGLPIWACALHESCGWHQWGFEAGPPGTHIVRSIEHEAPATGECEQCHGGASKLYELAHNGALICSGCYEEMCRSVSEANQRRAARIRAGLARPALEEMKPTALVACPNL